MPQNINIIIHINLTDRWRATPSSLNPTTETVSRNRLIHFSTRKGRNSRHSWRTRGHPKTYLSTSCHCSYLFPKSGAVSQFSPSESKCQPERRRVWSFRFSPSDTLRKIIELKKKLALTNAFSQLRVLVLSEHFLSARGFRRIVKNQNLISALSSRLHDEPKTAAAMRVIDGYETQNGSWMFIGLRARHQDARAFMNSYRVALVSRDA